MFDQASSLRELMRNVQKDNTLIAPNIKFQPKIPTVLAISGGKGGVGKTLTTANLGLCMARMGMRTLLIDGDFGLANLDVVLTPKINDYINSVMFFMILVGVIFLIPIIIFLLVYLNILNVETLKNNRKLIIFLSFVIAAIVTPPDPFSQIIIAMLMWFLYEISFILIKYFKI